MPSTIKGVAYTTFFNHFRQVAIDALHYEGHTPYYYQFNKYKTIK